jgi:signal transduction histidine kinase/DNA-binding NarL/FixJ family response regulator
MMNGLSILLLKPESSERDIAAELCSAGEGRRCQYATSVEDAVRLLTLQKFDVALVDDRLPAFSESNLIFELKQIADCPILVLAQDNRAPEMDKVIAQGASDIIFRSHLHAFRMEQAILQSVAGYKLEQEKQKLIGDFIQASFENDRILDQLQATNRKLTEEIALRNKTESKNALLIKAIHQISDEVVISNMDHTVVYRNRAVDEHNSILAKAPTSFSVADLFPPGSEDAATEMATAVANGVAWRGTVKGTNPENCVVTEQLSVFPIRDESNNVTHYVVIKRDITREQELEQRLLQSQKLESIGQLAAGIAHEINTPTQYVSDNVRFLDDSFNEISSILSQHVTLLGSLQKRLPDGDTVQQYIANVESADLDFLLEEIPLSISQSEEGLSRITRIVLAMKEFSHPGRDEKIPADINKAIRNTVQVCANEWKYVADVEFDLEEGLPQIPCHIGELNQVFLNLIVNSAHAIAVLNNTADAKGVIRIETHARGAGIAIVISDTGCGIPEKIIDRVFDPFFTTKEVGKGTGQGLSMAYTTIVETHSGKIDVASTPGKGATFTIYLPPGSDATVSGFPVTG